jgi:hypothetical protein
MPEVHLVGRQVAARRVVRMRGALQVRAGLTVEVTSLQSRLTPMVVTTAPLWLSP